MRRALGYGVALGLLACGAPGHEDLPMGPASVAVSTGGTEAPHPGPTPSPEASIYATGVSTLSGGEALALRPSGELVVKSLQDAAGYPVQLVAVDGGTVTPVGTYPLRNS